MSPMFTRGHGLIFDPLMFVAFGILNPLHINIMGLHHQIYRVYSTTSANVISMPYPSSGRWKDFLKHTTPTQENISTTMIGFIR